MKLREFCEGRNVKSGAVRTFISRNKDIFDGHIGDGREVELDSAAYDILNKKYPKIAETVIIKDNPETLQQVKELSEENKSLLKSIIQLQENINLLEKEKSNLLEERSNLLADQKLLLVEQDKNQKIEADLEFTKTQLEEVKEENIRLKSRGFFARLFNR